MITKVRLSKNKAQITRSQAVARIADRAASPQTYVVIAIVAK